MAHTARLSGARRDVRRRHRRASVRASRVDDRGFDGTDGGHRHARGPHPLDARAARPRASDERAGGGRRGARVRRAAGRDCGARWRRRGRCRGADRRRALRERRAPDRRHLQRQPGGDGGDAAGAGGDAGRPAAAIAVLGEMLELGDVGAGAARGVRPRGGAMRRRCARRRRRPRGRWLDRRRASPRACRRDRTRRFADAASACAPVVALVRRRRSRAGQGIARHAHRPDRRRAAGGRARADALPPAVRVPAASTSFSTSRSARRSASLDGVRASACCSGRG